MFSFYSLCVINQKRIEVDLDSGPLAKRMGKSRRGWVQDLKLCLLSCLGLWDSLPTHQHLTHRSLSFCNFFFFSCSELQFLFCFLPPLCSSYSPDSTQLVFKTMTSISQSQDEGSLGVSQLSSHPHHCTAVLCRRGKCVEGQQSLQDVSVA